MLLSRCLLAPSLTAFALLGGSYPAQAALTTYGNDDDFRDNAAFTKVGGANVRWGIAGPADWEYAVVDASDRPIAPSGQGELTYMDLPGYAAGSNSVANMQFTFSYSAAGELSLSLRDIYGASVGSATTVSGNITPNPGVNALALRAKIGVDDNAVIGPGDPGSDPSAAGVQGLRVNFADSTFFELGRLSGDSDAEYLMLTDSRLAGGFTITDTATLTDGSRSTPMWQFKLGTAPSPVPLPAAFPLLAAGLGMMGWVGRRRRQRAAEA